MEEEKERNKKQVKDPLMCGKFGHCKATKKCPIESLLTGQAGDTYEIVLPNGKTCGIYYKGLMEN